MYNLDPYNVLLVIDTDIAAAYDAFIYDTIVAKQLYRKLSFYNIFINGRNVLYLTSGNICIIRYIV